MQGTRRFVCGVSCNSGSGHGQATTVFQSKAWIIVARERAFFRAQTEILLSTLEQHTLKVHFRRTSNSCCFYDHVAVIFQGFQKAHVTPKNLHPRSFLRAHAELRTTHYVFQKGTRNHTKRRARNVTSLKDEFSVHLQGRHAARVQSTTQTASTMALSAPSTRGSSSASGSNVGVHSDIDVGDSAVGPVAPFEQTFPTTAS